MSQTLVHTILITDDDEAVGCSLARLLKRMEIDVTWASSAEAGIKAIRTAARPFSIIMSDQRLPGMPGMDFLEKSREISPDSVRFLLTGYADMDAITQAVNRGIIHRYIAKPWEPKLLMKAIKSGIQNYGLTLENRRIFALSRKQNAKLYALNTEFKKNIAAHQEAGTQRDRKIKALETRLTIGFEKRNPVTELEALLETNGILDAKRLPVFYAALMGELFEQFQDIATRNGFEIPPFDPGNAP